MNVIFRRAAPKALIIVVSVVVVTLAFLSNRLFHNLTSAVEQNQFDLMRTMLRSSLRVAAIGSPTFRTVSLRIYPDGQVELRFNPIGPGRGHRAVAGGDSVSSG
ncbi:MAG TPA: hypothetical protein VF626_00685 [Chthoniobacterales bacterium]|jgi:hypothetical protein